MHSHRCVGVMLALIACLSFTSDAQAESAVEKWLRILGISVTPQTKGPGDEIMSGDIWLAALSEKITRQRLTFDDGYQSPVFLPGDQAVLALKGHSIVRVSVFGGEPETVVAVSGITKLIGVSAAEPNEVLVLTEDAEGRASLGILSLKDGRIVPLPADKASSEDRRIINALKGWDRTYGDVTLRVERTEGQSFSGTKVWSDVYLVKAGQQTKNVSSCEEVDCGQPSLSHDGTRVVFVKAGGH